MVLRCSPVCEKQALFALFQSYKENHVEERLIKKVLHVLTRLVTVPSQFHLCQGVGSATAERPMAISRSFRR